MLFNLPYLLTVSHIPWSIFQRAWGCCGLLPSICLWVYFTVLFGEPRRKCTFLPNTLIPLVELMCYSDYFGKTYLTFFDQRDFDNRQQSIYRLMIISWQLPDSSHSLSTHVHAHWYTSTHMYTLLTYAATVE